MHESLTKLTTEEQLELAKQINLDYVAANKELQAEFENIYNSTTYDKNGELKNTRTINQKIKKITPLIIGLWLLNGNNIIGSSEKITAETWLFYEFVAVSKRKVKKIVITLPSIKKQVTETIKKRKKIIKWDKVIKGNARTLDKRVAKVIKKGLKNNKTENQIKKQLTQTMKLNSGKAKSIARTETNYYKSDAKLTVGRHQEKYGIIVYKTWVYTFRSKEPRKNHMSADNQVVKGIDGKFTVSGKKTVAPQHFEIASEDINCTCDYRVDYGDDYDIDLEEYNEYKKNK